MLSDFFNNDDTIDFWNEEKKTIGLQKRNNFCLLSVFVLIEKAWCNHGKVSF